MCGKWEKNFLQWITTLDTSLSECLRLQYRLGRIRFSSAAIFILTQNFVQKTNSRETHRSPRFSIILPTQKPKSRVMADVDKARKETLRQIKIKTGVVKRWVLLQLQFKLKTNRSVSHNLKFNDCRMCCIHFVQMWTKRYVECDFISVSFRFGVRQINQAFPISWKPWTQCSGGSMISFPVGTPTPPRDASTTALLSFPVGSKKQECFPVGCVPPALYRTGVGVSVWGVCPGGLSIGGRSLFRGSLSGRPPVDRDPPEGTWDQAARQKVTSYREPFPLWTEWLTDRCKNITFPQLSLRAVKLPKVPIVSKPLFGSIEGNVGMLVFTTEKHGFVNYSQSCWPHGSRPFHDLTGTIPSSTIPTVKPSMGQQPLGVVPAGSFFGNGW